MASRISRAAPRNICSVTGGSATERILTAGHARVRCRAVPEIEVLSPQHPIRRHIYPVLHEKPRNHPVGQNAGGLPTAALKRWIEVGELWLQPRLPALHLVHDVFRSAFFQGGENGEYDRNWKWLSARRCSDRT